ncbi:MAG: histidinol-phosphate transaminase [Gammaproteobacteria bacterium]|nr:histidinol-phosphate transaminase [Gammaproteobacteria bacterium]MBU1962862.1 histidinol-phosphate transaminase [Gammaproteobacteria bacterium]
MRVNFIDLATPGVQGLRPYIPGKPIEELERELGISGTLKLASNENPLGASPLGLAAATGAVAGLHLYPDDIGFRLRNKLAARFGVAPEAIVLGSGSSDVIDMVTRAFLGPGRNAVFAGHSFAMYPIFTQAIGAQGKVAKALPPDHPEMPYGHDLATLAAAVDADTRVVFIANPNNPTGTWLKAAALKAFIAALPEDVVVVLDEAYTEFVEEPEFPDGSRWLAEFPNLIVTRTFSKIFGLAGLRIGYGLAHPELAAVVGRVRHPFNVNSIALAAAEAALDDADFIRRSIAVNSAGLKQLASAFDEMGLRHIPSVGNFISVDVGRSGPETYQALLREGVIVRPIANYDLPSHLRVTVGLPEENARFLTALKKVLELR